MVLRNELIKELGLPNSIAEFVTPENFHKNQSEGYDYDAYQYRFDLIQPITIDEKNIPQGKYMIGAHKGVFGGITGAVKEVKRFSIKVEAPGA